VVPARPHTKGRTQLRHQSIFDSTATRGTILPALSVDQWAPFAAVSSIFARPESGSRVDAGFAVDTWRPSPLIHPIDFYGGYLHDVFNGIEVDVAVRNTSSVLHRVSYHVTLRGRIVFTP